ncbi:hypothetical protein E3T39_01855 [Cryobacterium suzukii]|uniref:DUF4145 domain-containing protein n=1 Tax=Cryobacterium suzukii TaxID=1259198 RepID=A0A4R9AIB9_9MICO|nr:hypothetical protein [Cryobacterium suzukii]TFD62707.1 hypothetical protein E3T39_01855 [Cryobacterium suzukii]
MLTWIEKAYAPELIRAVGVVVMTAAWVEDLAGELVQLSGYLKSDDPNKPVKGWAATGEQLAAALESVAGEELANRLRRAQVLRHKVVHGIFLDLGGLPDEHSGWASIKRNLSKNDPPSVEFATWKTGGLDTLIQEFAAIEDILDDEISYAMGLKERATPKERS